MKATAQMGGLTRQEIEYLTAQFALLAARAEWKPKSIDRIRAFGDLALQAIDREATPKMKIYQFCEKHKDVTSYVVKASSISIPSEVVCPICEQHP